MKRILGQLVLSRMHVRPDQVLRLKEIGCKVVKTRERDGCDGSGKDANGRTERLYTVTLPAGSVPTQAARPDWQAAIVQRRASGFKQDVWPHWLVWRAATEEKAGQILHLGLTED